MTDAHVAFVGSIPENYDRYLGPLLFRPYAEDLTARVPLSDGMRILLADTGFAEIEWARVEKTGESPSAAEAAVGLIEGNPLSGEITERRPTALPEVEAVLADRLRAELGNSPVRSPLSALVFTARRPT